MITSLIPYLLVSSALAYDQVEDIRCAGDIYMYGDPEQITFHIDTTDIPAGWISQIEAAMDAWSAGPGELNVGPEWRVVRGSNVGTHGLDNGKNEIWDESDAWFTANGFSGLPVVVLNEPNDDDVLPGFYTCPVWGVEYDIIFNDGKSWTTGLTSERTDLTKFAVGQVAMFALAEPAGIAAWAGPFLQAATFEGPTYSGDTSQEWRVSGNDFLALMDYHPCDGAQCADGSNVMLGRFVHDLWVNGTMTVLDDGVNEEVWDSTGDEFADEDWSAAQGVTIDSDFSPHPLFLQLTGTEDNVDVEVRWRLTQNANCGGTFWSVGSETVTMDAGQQMNIRLVPFTVPLTIPDGDYFLCAIADPLDVISETSEDDNNVRSETARFHVE